MSKQTNKEPSNDNTPKSKISKKKIGIISAVSVVAVIVIAAAIGLCIYNTPEKRIERQLALGNKYLEEENYEQAVLAFEQAIAIDDRCMEAYAGGIEAYLKIGDTEGLVNMYEKALGVIAGLDEAFVAENIDAIVEIYLFAEDVYPDNPERIEEILKEGLKKTSDERIKAVIELRYTVIQWQDKSLEKCIRDILGKANGDIKGYELSKIEIIECDHANITILNDLKYCTNLKELFLGYNNISDISVLGNLTKLENLYLIANNISDISALKNLSSLQKIELDFNNINDISVLKNLTNLTYLSLWENDISDINILENLTNLKILSLGYNNISDVSMLNKLTNLERLSLSGNNISDVSVLGNLTNLEYLNY